MLVAPILRKISSRHLAVLVRRSPTHSHTTKITPTTDLEDGSVMFDIRFKLEE